MNRTGFPGGSTAGGTSLSQSLNISNPFSSIGRFSIQDSSPTNQAGGDFTISLLTTSSIPEPAGMAVLAMGLIGLVAARARKARGV